MRSAEASRMPPVAIAGQLNPDERQMLREAVLSAPKKPQVVVEVGTWLGGGSTFSFLQALEDNGTGHLWGVEADSSIYEQMMANLNAQIPHLLHRFTPLFGFSDRVLPPWLDQQAKPFLVDVVFLDGGNHPGEQISEFKILDPHLPVGAQLFGHDAYSRKGKWLIPFMSCLDNWEVKVHSISAEGLFSARKLARQPSATSLAAANKQLTRLRWTPLEVAARVSPRWLKHMVFTSLPKNLSSKLAGK